MYQKISRDSKVRYLQPQFSPGFFFAPQKAFKRTKTGAALLSGQRQKKFQEKTGAVNTGPNYIGLGTIHRKGHEDDEAENAT